MNPIEKAGLDRRIAWLGGIFLLAFLAIGAKAIHLHVHRGEWLAEKAARQIRRTRTIPGKRGVIYDARGREMAISVESTSIAARPRRMDDPVAAARRLAPILGMDPDRLRLRLASRRGFSWLKRQASPGQVHEIRAAGIEHIEYVPEIGRFYPNRTVAAQVIGFTGVDGDGLEGLEFAYDARLAGGSRRLNLRQDALGKAFEAEQDMDAVASGGNNLILAMDRNIQYIAERALEDAVVAAGGVSGMAVVMVPNTGAVLAMANVPAFNPNAFARFPRETWRNRVVADAFEPGSTLKIFSAAAAIESGGCTPDTIFFCENGKYRIGKNTVHDTRPHGWLSLRRIIQYSSNIGAVKMGEMIGPERLYRTLRDFGFGDRTGIESPGETAGSVFPPGRWSRMDIAAISFGHGISVSALQLAAAASAIANDGVLMRPYLVKAITDPTGNPLETFEPREVRRVVSEKTARILRDMMRDAVGPGGTGERAALEGYAVCGKTGTAQKPDERGGYAEESYLASFVGFLPADAPRLTILVVIDEPAPDRHYGGVAAAPAFRRIALETMNYLNIPPGSDRLTAAGRMEAGG
jgi:cell division protein FtsI (penicillin-binding protein 3)